MIQTKTITMPLDLGRYDPAYNDQTVHVWVNPARDLLETRSDLVKAYIRLQTQYQKNIFGTHWALKLRQRVLDAKQARMMSRLWSAIADKESQWTPAEVRTLIHADPALYTWMVRESWKLTDEWRADKKK